MPHRSTLSSPRPQSRGCNSESWCFKLYWGGSTPRLHSACTATWSTVTHKMEKERSNTQAFKIGSRRFAKLPFYFSYRSSSHSLYNSNGLSSASTSLSVFSSPFGREDSRLLSLKIVCGEYAIPMDGRSSSRQTVSSPNSHQLFLHYLVSETRPLGATTGVDDWSQEILMQVVHPAWNR